MGDTHAPAVHPGYLEHLCRSRDKHQPDWTVHIGDLIDWHAISFHEKSQGTVSVEHERDKAQEWLDEFWKEFPQGTWIEGNHDALPRRQAAALGMPDDLLRHPLDYWTMEGWEYVDRFDSVEFDDVLYHHGEVGSQGQYAHVNQAKENQQSTVLGHLHSLCGFQFLQNRKRSTFGMAVGCGVDWKHPAMRYGRKFAKKPALACAFVLDGEPVIERMQL